MRRTADSIEESKAQREVVALLPQVQQPQKRLRSGCHPDVGKATQFKPGNRVNPGGRPKNDLAKQLAQEIFEENYHEAKAGLAGQLCKGNAYTFKELAERGYGKLKEVHEHGVTEGLADLLMQARERVNGNGHSR